VLAEKGDQQPRSLATAFLRPVPGQDQALDAITRLERQAKAFDEAYDAGADRRFIVVAEPDYSVPQLAGDVTTGSLSALIGFLGQKQ
jgi:CRISPR system Cascade subunit CasC